MERARIFFVEDDKDSRATQIEFLNYGGHDVVETAETLKEALGKIQDLEKKGVNVAIVDGNLSKNDTSGVDGETVALEIKAQHPNIIIIGRAAVNHICAADINCPKIQGLQKLVEIIDAI